MYIYFQRVMPACATCSAVEGANLAEMTRLGLPVPQGFTITTEACTRYYDDDRCIGEDIQTQIDAAVREMEKTGTEIGRSAESVARVCTFRCQSLHARYDGYHFKSWSQ